MSSKKNSISLKQISGLKKKIREQDELIKTYKQVLKESNKNIEKITKDLKKSFNLIGNIHRQLIPSDLPKVPHFKLSYKFVPTTKGVSGDFFDIIQLKNSLQFGIVLSSCSTYTLTSLFLSTVLKSVEKLKEIKNSKDFVTYLYNHLHSSLLTKEFVSVFFGIIDRREFTLDYCIVGDVFSSLRRGGSVSLLKSSSPPLQADLKCSFSNKKIDLHPKDALILCSSGIVKRQNKKAESFGTSRILKSIPKKSGGVLEIRQNILFQARQFGKGTPSLQDQTLLIIEVKDRILKLAKKV